MTLHLEILDDLQLDDMIHSATQVLNQNAPVLEDFAASHTYPALRICGIQHPPETPRHEGNDRGDEGLLHLSLYRPAL